MGYLPANLNYADFANMSCHGKKAYFRNSLEDDCNEYDPFSDCSDGEELTEETRVVDLAPKCRVEDRNRTVPSLATQLLTSPSGFGVEHIDCGYEEENKDPEPISKPKSADIILKMK